MHQACRTCNKTFENTRQQSICPHNLFPVPCDKHGRKHCGNLECDSANLIKELERLNAPRVKSNK